MKTSPIRIRLFLKLLLCIHFVLAVCACDQKKITEFETANYNTAKDSIKIWISQSKQVNTSPERRLFLLQKILKAVLKIENDTLKSDYLKRLSYECLKAKDTRIFKKVNREAILAAAKIKDSNSLANLYWDLGIFYRENSVKSDSSYYNYKLANNLFNALNDHYSSGRMLLEMAWIQNFIGDYTGSDITAIKAIEKLKSLDKFDKYIDLKRCYILLGDNAQLLNDYDRSLIYFNQALEYLKKSKSGKIKEQIISNSIALVYQSKGQHKTAIDYFKGIISVDSLRYKNPKLYARALSNLAYSYLKIDNTSQLPELFFKAAALQDDINDSRGKVSSNFRIAEYFLENKDTVNASKYLSEAKKMASLTSDNKALLKILRMYPRVDPDNVVHYSQEYLTLNDSLLTQERKIRNKFARIQFETDEFIAKNEYLSRQNKWWVSIAIALFLLGLATFIIVSQRIKNQNLRFKEQQQLSNQEIFNLLLSQKEKVQEGKKLEQKRISEELHDGVLGKMLGARMMLLGLNKKNDPAAVAERARAISILQEVEGEVRAISHELSHAAYQKIDNFILSIKDLLQTVKNASNINIDFEYSSELDYDSLQGEIKINLYRMIQEIIQNAVKHAACNNIKLVFKEIKGLLKVTISDDGKGFILNKGTKKGIGTRNIKSRIKKINGNWIIDSNLGKGTKVSLSIPIVNSNS